MDAAATNLKSDASAKAAFVQALLLRGFDEAHVTGSPADITARRGTDVYYFEIKFTSQEDQYFGAATLTEWEAALAHEERCRFVVAMLRDGLWKFHEYTPAEFMEFSSIPPFKVFFHIAVGGQKATRARRGNRRIQLTRNRVEQMAELFARLRSE